MKLEWEDMGYYHSAHTPFGSYTVKRVDGTGWQWGYCFDEYYDEDNFSCDSEADGKNAAENNWQERIAPIIAPYLTAPG